MCSYHKNCKDHSAKVVHVVVKALIYKWMDTWSLSNMYITYLWWISSHCLSVPLVVSYGDAQAEWVLAGKWHVLSLPDRAKPDRKAVVKITAPLFPGCCCGIVLPDYSNFCIICGVMEKLVSEMRVVVQQALVLQALVGWGQQIEEGFYCLLLLLLCTTDVIAADWNKVQF